jgi:hypothetical protein
MSQIPPFQKNGKFKFAGGQLHKVVFDIKNPDDQETPASEYSVIEKDDYLSQGKTARAVAAIRWPHPCRPYPRCTGRRIPPGGDGQDI